MIYCFFFIFYSTRKIYLCFTTFPIYFINRKRGEMELVMEQISTVKDKISAFHQFFVSRNKWFKKLLNKFICFFINYDFYAIIFECITCSSSMSIEEIKLIAIGNWIFYVLEFLRVFIMPVKYGSVSLTYSLFYFYHHYCHIQYNSCYKNYLFLLAFNNLFPFAQKCS